MSALRNAASSAPDQQRDGRHCREARQRQGYPSWPAVLPAPGSCLYIDGNDEGKQPAQQRRHQMRMDDDEDGGCRSQQLDKQHLRTRQGHGDA